jgi:type III secretory pathway component EscR
MKLIIFLPLILITATGLVLLSVVIPTIFKQNAQFPINISMPTLTLPNTTLFKTPIIDECAHNHKNQTLDSGILCLPNDTKLMENYNGAPII